MSDRTPEGGAWDAGPSPETTGVRVRAHAKLNLTLRVLGVRDDGYHDIEALTGSLDRPHDLLEVVLTGTPDIELQVAEAAGPAEIAGGSVPRDASNLAARAAQSILRRVEPGAGARLRLKKLVPAGAGLGGGSADAAAVLAAVGRLLPMETAGVDLDGVAASIGSDVPFCLRGGLAWMRGRGERIEHLAPPPDLSAVAFVVATPPQAVPTPDVYRAWDSAGGPKSDRRVPAPAALRSVVTELVNDLEPAALAVAPELKTFRDRLEAATGLEPLLAGSGSSYFVVTGAAEADDLASEVEGALAGEARYVGVARITGQGISWLEA